jgi:hypothetical protein
MLGPTAGTRVFVKTGATDLRLAFEGSCALVVNVIHQDPPQVAFPLLQQSAQRRALPALGWWRPVFGDAAD